MVSSRIDDLLDSTVLLSFTNVGYALRKSDWAELPRMDGKTVVITGATSGLGRAAAHRLDGLGANLVIVGRNEAKLNTVQAEMGGRVATEQCDLSSLAETRRLAERLLALDRLDVLINNAGAMFAKRELTAEGFERTFVTNLLSGFLLTEMLIPKLVESAPARIINMSSGGMYTRRLSVSDLQNEKDYKPSDAYAHTKRAQVVLTELWAERLAPQGVTVHAVHPGWADTAGVQDALPAFRKMVGPFLRSAEQGADTMVWLAAADEPAEASGQFWLDRRPRPTHRLKSTVESEAARMSLIPQLRDYAGLT